jgi:hypothetical protein
MVYLARSTAIVSVYVRTKPRPSSQPLINVFIIDTIIIIIIIIAIISTIST